MAVVALSACARAPSGRAGTSSPNAAPTDATTPSAQPVTAPSPPPSWRAAIRAERWSDAADILDRLDPAGLSPPAHFARARVAFELGDPKGCIFHLQGLEQALPLLASEVTHYRAEAQLQTGPYSAAAAYYGKLSGFNNRFKYAQALHQNGQHTLARKELVKLNKKARSASRRLRVRSLSSSVAEAQKDWPQARQDWRWLVLNAPSDEAAIIAVQKLESPEHTEPLTKQQRFDRALKLARAGMADASIAELARIEHAPGAPIAQAELLHVEGWARYSVRDYTAAAKLLSDAAEGGSRHAVRDLYYSAKAVSRAHYDDFAIPMYFQHIESFPQSQKAHHARFLIARLHFLQGRYSDAVEAFKAYFRRYGRRGRHASARYDLALSQLLAENGEAGAAAKTFAQLAKETDNRRVRAEYEHLEAVSLAAAGDTEAAKSRFRRLISEHPLSFVALAGAQRLRTLGEPAQALIPEASPAPDAPPLTIQLPAKVELLNNLGLNNDAEVALKSYETEIRSRHGARGFEALCKSYSKLSSAAQRYRTGQRGVRSSALNIAPTSATQWMWECVYPSPYEELVQAAEAEWQLPEDLIYAVMRQESGFRPHVVSPAKAVGLMQLIPPTARNVAKELSVEYNPSFLESPPHNIRFGGYYLKKVLSTFSDVAPLAVAAYNAGPIAVSHWLEAGEELPLDLFVAKIPYRETRGYVHRVIGNWARYRYLRGGAEALPKLSWTLPQGLRASPEAY